MNWVVIRITLRVKSAPPHCPPHAHHILYMHASCKEQDEKYSMDMSQYVEQSHLCIITWVIVCMQQLISHSYLSHCTALQYSQRHSYMCHWQHRHHSHMVGHTQLYTEYCTKMLLHVDNWTWMLVLNSYLLGNESCTIASKFWLPLRVDSPISVLPVAAMSNRQNGSSPHISIASDSRAGSENSGWYVGMKDGA